MTRSAESRFFAVVSGTLFLVVAPLLALFLALSAQQISKTQGQHLDILMITNAQALAKPLWDFDIEGIEQIIATLVSDPSVRRVDVRDTAGLLARSRSDGENGGAGGFEKITRPIHYKSLNGMRHVGWIDIYFSPVGLFSALDLFSVALTVIFLLAILTVFGTAVIGNRLMILKPLTKLSDAIDATRRLGSRHHVDWSSNDEIGRLAQSFNEMQIQLEREEQELKWAHQHTTEIYNRTPAMLFSVDAEGCILAVSDYWLVATGHARANVVGKPFSSLLDESDRDVYAARRAGRETGEAPREVTVRFVCAGGRRMDVLIAETGLPAAGTRPAIALSVMTDVTDLRQSEQLNRQQAVTDHLTGLLNRQGFETALDRKIAETDLSGTELVCLFIDLDRFKSVNDTLGHPAGDSVLRQFVARLKALLTPDETAARLGGDEFSVLVGGADASRRGTDLCAGIVSLFEEPFAAGGGDVRLSASIGLALYPLQASDAAELLQKSDMAMYTRKREGKNGAHIFDPSMLDRARRQAEIEKSIETALSLNWFEAYFQPVYDLSDNRIAGFEALLRLDHPQKGLQPPAEIIGVAEETGSIGRIGTVMLERAVMHLASISDLEGMQDAYVAVNFSSMQFDPGLGARIAAVLSHHGLRPQRLVVEITEAVLMNDNPEVRETLEEISRFGCRIALDDFGTGYSSLSYLNRFPVDIVKIDQSFIRAMDDPSPDVSGRSRMLIEGIAAISHKMNCTVIAEGVETERQSAALREMGIDCGQGYLFSKPLSLEDLRARRASGSKTESAAG